MTSGHTFTSAGISDQWLLTETARFAYLDARDWAIILILTSDWTGSSTFVVDLVFRALVLVFWCCCKSTR